MTTRIIGTGSYAPEKIVTNDDLAKIVDTNDEWIKSRTGIERRHISEGMGMTELATKAANKAIEDAGIDPEEIDIIIVGTSSADMSFPSSACLVQTAVGAKNAVAFDISAACAGFIYALNIVHSFIQAGIYKTGLIIGSDVLSKVVDWTDRGTCVLFGDAAGAAVVRADETGIAEIQIKSDGEKANVLECIARSSDNFLTGKQPQMGFMKMDGQEVFKFAVKKVPESIKEVLAKSGTDIEEIKYFILHQANSRIFESIAKRLKISMDKIPMNIQEYGNTSAATIPVLLDEMNKAGKLQKGDKLVLSGFGAGLTWGSAILEW